MVNHCFLNRAHYVKCTLLNFKPLCYGAWCCLLYYIQYYTLLPALLLNLSEKERSLTSRIQLLISIVIGLDVTTLCGFKIIFFSNPN